MRWTPAGDGNLAQPLLGRHAEREDVSAVIDVAMTETAAEAHYILPARTQYEKMEATFFNLEFRCQPINTDYGTASVR